MAHPNTGHFVWHELLTNDPKAAMSFYSELVGWKTEPFGEGGGYHMWLASQGPLGGVMALPEEVAKMGAPPHWMGNIQVENVDSTAVLAKKLGGKAYKEPSDIPNVGRYAVLGDPQGAVIGVFAPQHVMSLHDTSKPGEFCWNELMTSDSTAAFKFYAELFGWTTIQEMDMGPMGTYRIFGVGEKAFGGMMNTPKGSPMPPSWTYYVETNELGQATARATKMGAKVMNGPMDVPGGKITQFTDPQGVWFALHEQKK